MCVWFFELNFEDEPNRVSDPTLSLALILIDLLGSSFIETRHCVDMNRNTRSAVFGSNSHSQLFLLIAIENPYSLTHG